MDDAALLDGEGDALLRELLAWLDESPTPTASDAKTRKARSGGGGGSAARRRLALEALRREAEQLTQQLERLRGARREPFYSVRERAAAERLRRQRAERECRALRAAVFQQKRFLRGFGGLWARGPCMTAVGFDLCHYLHTPTRLPRDRSMRQGEYRALSSAERFDAAIELLCHETEAISVVDAFLETDYRHESEWRCAATTKSVFTLERGDVAAVLRAACVALREILMKSRPFKNVSLHGEIVDPDANALSQNNIQYRATSVHKQSDDCEDFSIESLELSMYRLTGDTAVMLWDFVDEDERRPLQNVADISRKSVGACLIREELCPDGVKRVVYRELSMRQYEYRGGESTPPPSVQRYFSSKQSSVGPNELVFRSIIASQIDEEERALARLHL